MVHLLRRPFGRVGRLLWVNEVPAPMVSGSLGRGDDMGNPSDDLGRRHDPLQVRYVVFSPAARMGVALGMAPESAQIGYPIKHLSYVLKRIFLTKDGGFTGSYIMSAYCKHPVRYSSF